MSDNIIIKLTKTSAEALAAAIARLNANPVKLRKLLPKSVPSPSGLLPLIVITHPTLSLLVDPSRPYWLQYFLVVETAAKLPPKEVAALHLALGLVDGVGPRNAPHRPYLRYSVTPEDGVADSFVMELPFRVEASRERVRKEIAGFIAGLLDYPAVSVAFDDELPEREEE